MLIFKLFHMMIGITAKFYYLYFKIYLINEAKR